MDPTLPLRIELAGFNVDRETLAALEQAAFEDGDAPAREAITPETLSAAYARISRNPADISEIRRQARTEVEKARRSNETIVFGLGHASVAEHAVFNIDVKRISRLAVEAIERHRLVSYTEKSQRYITLDGDVVVPPEIHDAGLQTEFQTLIREQNQAYSAIEARLFDLYYPRFKEDGEGRPKTRARGKAAEDARYVVSLATEAQFGMTLNARSLESMIRDALAHPLAEVREAGRQLADTVKDLAPSLVKYVETTDAERAQFSSTCFWAGGGMFGPSGVWEEGSELDDLAQGNSRPVRLLHHTEDAEKRVLTALLVRMHGLSWEEAADAVKYGHFEGGGVVQPDVVFRNALRANAPWDPPPREFELAEFTFEVILSAAAFGQLKRHRMSTQIIGPYDPSLGWTMPETIAEVGMEREFNEILARSARFAWRIAEQDPEDPALRAAAPYALCNAHRRRVIFRANARELYHVSRLREDLHAQWDIRELSRQMLDAVRERFPALFVMAVGKHEFADRHRQVYGDPDPEMLS